MFVNLKSLVFKWSFKLFLKTIAKIRDLTLAGVAWEAVVRGAEMFVSRDILLARLPR